MQVIERLYEPNAVRPPDAQPVLDGPLCWLPSRAQEPALPVGLHKPSDSTAISLSNPLSPICEERAASLHPDCSSTEPFATNARERNDTSQLRHVHATAGMLLVGALALLVLKVRISDS